MASTTAMNCILIEEDGTTTQDKKKKPFSYNYTLGTGGGSGIRTFLYNTETDGFTNSFVPIDLIFNNEIDIVCSNEIYFEYDFLFEVTLYLEAVEIDLIDATYLNGLSKVNWSSRKPIQFQSNSDEDQTFTYNYKAAYAQIISYNAAVLYGAVVRFFINPHGSPGSASYTIDQDFKSLDNFPDFPDSPFIMRTVSEPSSNNDDINFKGIVY